MFGDDWTPAHLQSGATNLYKEIALALKAEEWRKPGLVALASKLNTSAGPRTPIHLRMPEIYETYKPLKGPNPWLTESTLRKSPLSLRPPSPGALLDTAGGAMQEMSDRIKGMLGSPSTTPSATPSATPGQQRREPTAPGLSVAANLNA